MKNQMGFSMLSISFLIPILFFSCMVVVGSYQLIARYTDIQRECRSHVLKAQQILGKKLKELMDLNPQARTLRAEEKVLRAEIATALATFPPAAIPFVKLLEINLLRQGVLRGRQEIILSTATTQAKRIIREYESDFSKTQDSQIKNSPVLLKVYKTPISAVAPDHLPVPFFTELQTIKINWRISIGEILPTKLLKLFSNTPNAVQGKCSATLIKKGNVWNPKLHLAKF